ncbi:MAG TPA: hypothetical protein PLN21_10945 [Gemmatales bacterium]|nr:hypothetical protein [Gemmatales bacterium]
MARRYHFASSILAWLLCIAFILTPTIVVAQVPPEKQIQITDVRVGFPAGSLDLFKEGKWVPVLVTVGPPKEVNVIPGDFQGTLEVSTKDSDGWNTHIFKDSVVVTKEANRAVFQSYIKVSDAASFNGVIVRLRGKLGTTEINQTYSYPQNDRTRNNVQYGVDHEKLLVVNIGNSYGFVSTDDNEEASNGSGRSNVPQQMPRRAASPNKIFELPDRWYGYESVDAVIIATGGNFGNSLAQQLARDPVRRDALEQWVLQGGHLIISVAGNAQMVASPTDFPLEPLFPMKVDRSGAEKEARLDGLRDFIIQGIPQNIRKSKGEIRGPKAPYARLDGKPGVKALNAAVVGDDTGSKRPLIVRSPYGLGKITIIGFDTNTEAFQSWEHKHDFWGAILEARTVTAQTNNYYGNTRDDASLALANRIEEFGDVPVISFAVVALFIALYIILIGPVDYFVLKKVFKRLEYTWITFPTVVLLVSLAAYYGAYYLKGDKLRINKVDLVEIDIARERVMGMSWFAIFSPRLQNYNIDLEPQGVSSATPTLSWLGRYSLYGGSRMTGQSQGGLFERDYDYTPNATGLRQIPIQVWSQKSLEGRWLGTMDRSRPPIESSLVKERLYITGKIRSKLPGKLYGAKLLFADKVWNLGDMEPDKEYDLSKLDQNSAGVMSANYFERKLSRSGDNAQQPDFAADMNGLLFASRSSDGNTKPNEFLRFLNQSWRLKDYGEAVLVGTLADEYGDAVKVNQGGSLGTKLKLSNGAGADLVTGTMRQSTFLRVFIPVKESSTGP